MASVVIPARNAAGTLDACLFAVVGQDRVREVIVVDDGATDRTAEIAARHGARIVRLDGRGPAAARNAGARAAVGDVVVFIDADCIMAEECVASLLGPFADPEVSGSRGAYRTKQRSLVARFVQLELEEKQARLAAGCCLSVVDTACAAYRRSVFLRHGGFDEEFPATSAEDIEFSFRLRSRGATLRFVPEAKVFHQHPERVSTYLWRKARFGFFRVRVYQRYPGRVMRDGYTPHTIPVQIALVMLLVMAGAGSGWRAARRGLIPLALAFGATTLPFIRLARLHDPGVAPIVLPLVLARSLAQGAGLVAGVAALGWRLVSRRCGFR